MPYTPSPEQAEMAITEQVFCVMSWLSQLSGKLSTGGPHKGVHLDQVVIEALEQAHGALLGAMNANDDVTWDIASIKDRAGKSWRAAR